MSGEFCNFLIKMQFLKKMKYNNFAKSMFYVVTGILRKNRSEIHESIVWPTPVSEDGCLIGYWFSL